MDRGAWLAAQRWVQLKPLGTSTRVANEMGKVARHKVLGK